jgi:hypothetical protein
LITPWLLRPLVLKQLQHILTALISDLDVRMQCTPKPRDASGPVAADGTRKVVMVNARAVFRAPEGWAMLSADYCQIELRVMAHLSKDGALLRALASPQTDPFTALAAEVCGVEPAEVTTVQRGRIKQICYGLLYGMGLQALSRRLECDINSARDWRDRFLAKYPAVRPGSLVHFQLRISR